MKKITVEEKVDNDYDVKELIKSIFKLVICSDKYCIKLLLNFCY